MEVECLEISWILAIRMKFFLSLFLLASCHCSYAQISALQVIKSAAERDTTIRERRLDLEYDMLLTVNTLDEKGNIVSSKQEKKTMQPQRLITYAVDVDDTEERVAAGEQPANDSEKNLTAQFSITDMIDRFHFEHRGEESIRDLNCYKIHFNPKPDQPYHSREEKVINAITGHIWIDKKTYSIVQTIGKLTRDVEVAWFFATMKTMNFTYQTQNLPNGDIGPALFNLTFHVDATLFQIRRNQISLFQNHRPIQKENGRS